jgi:hypothetical protein
VPSVRADVIPRWTEHTQPVHGDVDPVHGFIRWKLIHYSDYSKILQRGPWTFVKSTRGPNFADFALRPLKFSEINPRSMIFFQFSPKFEKYLQKVPSLRKIHKNSSKTSKINIFPTTTPNPVILVPKFLESLPLSFYAFI